MYDKKMLWRAATENDGKQTMRPHAFTWKDHKDYQNGSVADESPWDVEEWNSTLAPGSLLLTVKNQKWNNYANAGMTSVNISGETYYPYKPGYASAINDDTMASRLKSAGVDCVGLVQRSASYSSGENANGYELSDLSGYTWTKEWIGDRKYIVAEKDNDMNWDNSYQLLEITAKPKVGKPVNLDKVIPGDIVYYRGYHIMTVAEVEYNSGTRTTCVDKIKLIEATTNNIWKIYFVAKKNSLESCTNSDMSRNWVIGRLK